MENQMKNKKPRYFLKYILMRGLGLISLVLPLLILVIVEKDTYFQVKTRQSVTIAMFMACVVFLLQIKGFTKKWNSAIWLMVFAFIIHFLKPILGDLEMILWMASIGQIVFKFIFEPLGDRYKKLSDAYKQGQINAETQKGNVDALVQAIKDINTLGR